MGLAVLAQVGAVGVQHGGGVIEHPGHLLFVYRHDHDHAMFPGQFLHQPHRRAAGRLLRQLPPPVVLLGGEVGAVEQLLQAQYFDAPVGGFLDERDVLVEHKTPKCLYVLRRVPPDPGLNQPSPYYSRHPVSPLTTCELLDSGEVFVETTIKQVVVTRPRYGQQAFVGRLEGVVHFYGLLYRRQGVLFAVDDQ